MSDFNNNYPQSEEEKQEDKNEVKDTQPQILKQKPVNRNYIIGAIVFVLLLSICGYWYWTTTPKYSLQKAFTAISNHDLIAYDKYVDTDTVVSRMIDQLLSSQDLNSEDGINALATGIVQMIKPKLVEMAKEQIRSFVEKGDFETVSTDNNGPSFSIGSIYNRSSDGQDDAQYRGIDYVKKNGNICFVGIKIYNPKLEQEIIPEIKMRKVDSYWQIAEISNLSEMIKKIDEAENAKLEQLNKSIIDQINQAVIIDGLFLDKYSDSWGFSNYVIIGATFNFQTEKSVKEINTKITIKNNNDKVLLDMTFKSEGSFYKGNVSQVEWKKDINPFIAEDKELFETSNENLFGDIQNTSLIFEDGTELKIYDKLP